ncbi:hypothetical protein [Microscilla marina]|uniref:Transposase n=1 Tax=Microscilla marina ATCC 23134 TaxID=313606 RepID=A1ZMQ6_MICM2|nr:hypothetical protein [Microscilla marina]EAY28436.1 hypothetical protein M23134_03999 [Microscilla marina ATCC 23134]
MALTYDIEKDAFYLKGVKKGKEEGVKEGIKKGREEGKQEEKTALILGLLKSGKMTLQEIASLTKVTVAEIQKMADQKKHR